MLDNLCITQPLQNSMTPVTIEDILCDWLFHWNINTPTTVHQDTLDWNQCTVIFKCSVCIMQFTVCSDVQFALWVWCDEFWHRHQSASFSSLTSVTGLLHYTVSQSWLAAWQHGCQQEGKPCPATCQQSRISLEIIQKYLEMPTANGQEKDQNQYDILDEMWLYN